MELLKNVSHKHTISRFVAKSQQWSLCTKPLAFQTPQLAVLFGPSDDMVEVEPPDIAQALQLSSLGLQQIPKPSQRGTGRTLMPWLWGRWRTLYKTALGGGNDGGRL